MMNRVPGMFWFRNKKAAAFFTRFHNFWMSGNKNSAPFFNPQTARPPNKKKRYAHVTFTCSIEATRTQSTYIKKGTHKFTGGSSKAPQTGVPAEPAKLAEQARIARIARIARMGHAWGTHGARGEPATEPVPWP